MDQETLMADRLLERLPARVGTPIAKAALQGRRGVRPTEEAYAELQQAYDHFNAHLFDGQLPGALLTLQRAKDTFGYFSRNRFVGRRAGEKVDEIALNPCYFAVVPLVEILQTLVHEMVHQWQHHFGEPGRTRYHNHQWADKMEQVGLVPSDTGRPGGRKVGQKVADYAKEGGRFLAACEQLLRGDFAISWLDRFPGAKQLDVAADLPSIALPDSSGGGQAPMHELVAQHKAAAGAAASAPFELPQGPKVQTRVRYTCQCSSRVWGRPGLKILCVECSSLYAVD